MKRKTVYLLVQSLLCALIAGLLAAGALRLYLDGAARQAEGDMFYYMFTRERVTQQLQPVLPLILVALGLTAGGVMLGIRDECADLPVRDARLLGEKGSIRMRAVPQASDRRTLVLRTVVLVVAGILIVAGILNGGLEDVLAKGAAICTECVGLG